MICDSLLMFNELCSSLQIGFSSFWQVSAGIGKFFVMNDHGEPGSLLKFRRGCQGVQAVQKAGGAEAYLSTDSKLDDA
jgi:hypothetical protein